MALLRSAEAALRRPPRQEALKRVLGLFSPRLSEAFWPKPVDQKIDPWRFLLQLFLLAFAAMLLFIALKQSPTNDWPTRRYAFDAEDTIATSKLWFCITWGALGAGFSAYYSSLSALFVRCFAGEQPTFGLPVQAGIILVMILLLAHFLEPAIFENLTSFKAGEVEAHFAESASKIQSAPFAFLDLGRDTALSRWFEFHYLTKGKNYRGRYDSSENEKNYREYINALSGAEFWRVKLADDLFSDSLQGILDLGYCLDKVGEGKVLKQDREFAAYAQGFAALIAKTLRPTGRVHTESARLRSLSIKAWIVYTRWKGDIEFNSDDAVSKDVVEKCKGLASEFLRFKDTSLNLQNRIEHLDPDLSLWDPYVIAAVSDLLGFAYSEQEQADFLEDISSEIDFDYPCRKKNHCEIASPGLTNLYYYLLQHKISSGQSWPFDRELADIHTALTWIEDILRSAYVSNGSKEGDNARRHYLENKLADLGVALELFYRHALAGGRLGGADEALWQDWITETQYALQAIDGVGNVELTEQTEKNQWASARSLIYQHPLILYTAATATALGLILNKPEQTHVSAYKCLAAKSLLAYADSLYPSVGTSLADEENAVRANGRAANRATLKAFLDQVEGRLTIECPAR